MIISYIILFLASLAVLFLSGPRLVKALMRIAKFLGLREFVVAFFVMAVAASIPNLFVGVNAALHKIPELSLGEIMGGNLVDLTLAIGLAVIIGGGSVPAGGKVVQTSALFTAVIAVLPMILLIDGVLGRGDGLILLLTFLAYVYWFFSQKERFTKVYSGHKNGKTFKGFAKDLLRLAFFAGLLLLASEGVVRSARFLAGSLGLTLPLVGIFIVGLGNALPELYFAVASARKRRTWMILGDLMGSVIVCATFVLGVVALIEPIKIDNFSPFAVARIFLILSALFFLMVVRTDFKITRREGFFFVLLYFVFLAVELLLK